MAEDDDTMMLELMKKKKKKKPANLDALISSSANTDSSSTQEKVVEKVADELEELGLSGKKKKKKAKITFADDTPKADGDRDSGDELMSITKENDPDDLNLSELKKKKHKTAIVLSDDEDIDSSATGLKSWLDSDRDYTYDELLTRVFDIMRKKNPEMIAGEKKKFVMKPPQCARVGTRKTSFINFSEICQVLRRQPKHVLAFILAELGTSGSVDGNNQLIIKGRFQQKQLESVLRRYIKEYVTCHTCRSPDTVLERKDRLYFLRCNVCQSRCSVTSIKSGFQAVTGKRARMRAKAT